MGCGASVGSPVPEVQAANGQLRKGVRCQTQWEREEGGNDKWYCATVQECYDSGKAKLVYDDGDTWTGKAVYIYLLPPGHPGAAQKVPQGADTQAGPAGLVQSVAQPVYGLQPAMHMQQPPPMYGQPMMSQPVVMGQPMPMMEQPMMGQPMPMMGQPQVMTVVANVPGGHTMTLEGPNGMPMNVTVPPGVQPGQQFQFQM